MKNNALGFLIIICLVWFFAKDDNASREATTEQKSSYSVTPEYTKASPQIADVHEPLKIRYVNTSTLKVRATPDGRLLETLSGGTQVKVYEQKNSWSRISPASENARWVSSNYLCEFAGCYVKKTTPTSSSAPQKLRSEYPPSPTRRQPGTQYGSSCPCSSGIVCTGPRGGRYCITSGGNKRYGV